MNISPNLVIIIIIIIVFAILLGKMLLPFFTSYTVTNGDNLDLLIAKEKDQLQRRGLNTNYRSQTEELILTSLDDTSPEKKNLKALFNNLQWGSGEKYQEICELMKEENLVIEFGEISKVFQLLIREKVLLAHLPNIPKYQAIIELIASIIILWRKEGEGKTDYLTRKEIVEQIKKYAITENGWAKIERLSN